MSKKMLVVVLGILAVLAFVWLTVGLIIGRSGGPEPTPAPTATPTPKATPTAKPTSTPTPGVVEVTVEELIRQLTANPNKYPKGTIIQVSGELDMRVPISWDNVVHLLKPASANMYTGYYVIILVENFATSDWAYVPLTSEVVVRGRYDGFYEIKTVNSTISPKGPVILEPVIISSSK